MDLKKAKGLGALLQLSMFIAVGLLIYFEIMKYFWLGLGLVMVMFMISMSLLFLSEIADEQQANEKVKQRS
jgi:hypothetical protein